MCYYTDQTSSKKALENRFKATANFLEDLLLHGKQSGFARPKLPVQTQGKPEMIQLIPWGLIPHWADEQTSKEIVSKTLNAKSETIFEKPSFEPYVMKQKCLVLVDGFFEWQHQGKEKVEYRISKKEEGPFAMGGIYSIWMNPETRKLEPSFSIITTAANEMMEEIHNTKKRMPLILEKEAEEFWLKTTNYEEIKALMKPFDSNKMQAEPLNENKQLGLFE